jgi:hypothetical protein
MMYEFFCKSPGVGKNYRSAIAQNALAQTIEKTEIAKATMWCFTGLN